MITIQRDSWERAEKGIRTLIDGYWAEVRHDVQMTYLDLNGDLYRYYETEGKLVLVTACDKETLIGFAIFFAFVHHHYQSSLCGHNDSWFLSPTYRSGMTGVKLFRKALSPLSRMGCTHVYAISTIRKDVTPLLKRLRFEPVETVHCLALDPGNGEGKEG
jgi:N-acetylglutamate synthase-like GNAT family acetyltransferase